MTWVDWLIVIVFGYLIFTGFRKGFVQQLFDLLGSVAALVLAFHFYQSVGSLIAAQLQFSTPLADIIGFILIVVLLSGIVSFIGKRWRAARKNEPIAVFDGGLGAVFGGFKAAVILVVVILLLLALPWEFVHGPIEASDFANDLLRLTPAFYAIQNIALPPETPRMVISAEGLRWRAVDYRQLKNATCLACGSKVEYQGMVKKGFLEYPRTYCPKCHRYSDGCLTFEGYHMLNGACPYERLGSLGTIDCKTWPNPEPATVKGKCPVCGRTQ